MSKKNILFIIDTLDGGGAEKTLNVIIDNLNYKKYNIDLLVLKYYGYYCGKINNNVNVIPLVTSNEQWFQIFRDGSYDTLLHQKLSQKYDVQISFLEGFSAVVACYYGNYYSKKIGWIHCDPDMRKEYLLEFKNDYYNMDKIIFVSDGCINPFVKLMGESIRNKCITLNNPIDIEFILNQSKEPINYTKEKLTLLAIGRLSPEKGFQDLILSHNNLLKDGLDNELIILGDGPYYRNLSQLIDNLHLSNSVKLIGFRSNPYPWIAMCDILVCPSKYEAYSLVIAEGMILEKPIVSTLTVGSTSLLQYKYGLLVENSKEGLYQGLKTLITSEKLRDYYKDSLSNTVILNIQYSMKKIEDLLDS